MHYILDDAGKPKHLNPMGTSLSVFGILQVLSPFEITEVSFELRKQKSRSRLSASSLMYLHHSSQGLPLPMEFTRSLIQSNLICTFQLSTSAFLLQSQL